MFLSAACFCERLLWPWGVFLPVFPTQRMHLSRIARWLTNIRLDKCWYNERFLKLYTAWHGTQPHMVKPSSLIGPLRRSCSKWQSLNKVWGCACVVLGLVLISFSKHPHTSFPLVLAGKPFSNLLGLPRALLYRERIPVSDQREKGVATMGTFPATHNALTGSRCKWAKWQIWFPI